MSKDLMLPSEPEIQSMPVTEIVSDVLPKAMFAIEQADTVEDVNEIRNRIVVIGNYLKRKLPVEMSDRWKRLEQANKTNKVYLEACRKAGVIWDGIERYKGRPPDNKSVKDLRFLTVEEAGFPSRQDAQNCTKLARIHEQDWDLYFEETVKANRQFTVGGLVYVYDLLNPKEKPKEDGASPKFADKVEKLCDQVHEVMIQQPDGDVRMLLQTAHESLSDAHEILDDLESTEENLVETQTEAQHYFVPAPA